MISYEDFKKVEMKIGTVTAAERVPDTDKLIKCTVNVGEDEPRTIVSGIAEHYPDPEELVGKQFPYVLNLEPRTIRGIESQGMIMAVGGEHGIALMSPDTDVIPGSPIS